MTRLDPAHRPSAWTPDELASLFRDHAAGLAGAVRGVLGGAAARTDVQEVLQDTYLKALRASPGTRPESPAGWIFVIALNQARDLRRRSERRGRTESFADQPLSMTPDMTPDPKTPVPSEPVERAEAVRAARTAIARLAEPEREMFLLRVSADLSFEAAARTLGIPVGTAKTRMRSALAKLRKALAAYGPELEGVPFAEPARARTDRSPRP